MFLNTDFTSIDMACVCILLDPESAKSYPLTGTFLLPSSTMCKEKCLWKVNQWPAMDFQTLKCGCICTGWSPGCMNYEAKIFLTMQNISCSLLGLIKLISIIQLIFIQINFRFLCLRNRIRMGKETRPKYWRGSKMGGLVKVGLKIPPVLLQDPFKCKTNWQFTHEK